MNAPPPAAPIAPAPATPAPTTPAAPTAQTTPAPPPGVLGHPQAEISETEAAKMASWAKEDLIAGRISQAQADKIFSELNTPLEQRTTEDLRSDNVKLLDEHFPPAKERDYTICYGKEMTPELKAFDATARTWLSGAEFPRELGNSLVNAIEKVAQHTSTMTPDQLENYRASEYMKLKRALGPALDDKLRAADDMIEVLEAKQPGVKNVLASKGIGRDAMIWSMIIQQAERYWARRKGR